MSLNFTSNGAALDPNAQPTVGSNVAVSTATAKAPQMSEELEPLEIIEAEEETALERKTDVKNQPYPVDAKEYPVFIHDEDAGLGIVLRVKPISRQMFEDYFVQSAFNRLNPKKIEINPTAALFDCIYKTGTATNLETKEEKQLTPELLKRIRAEQKTAFVNAFISFDSEVQKSADKFDFLFENSSEIRIDCRISNPQQFQFTAVFNPSDSKARMAFTQKIVRLIRADYEYTTEANLREQVSNDLAGAFQFVGQHFNRVENCLLEGQSYEEVDKNREKFLRALQPTVKYELAVRLFLHVNDTIKN